MTELLTHIQDLIATSDRDLDRIERTLTDGYAHALHLEAERWRIERRLAEVAQGIQRGDTAKKTQELSALARRLDGAASELVELRSVLVDLRQHADLVRASAA